MKNIMVIPSDAKQLRRTIIVGIILVILTLISIPFADIQLKNNDALLPIFISINIMSELITAYIFFAQYRISRSFPILILGLTYLYSGLITIPYLLTYPGVFSASGLMQAGSQTSIWIWYDWHVGFLIGILIYIGCIKVLDHNESASDYRRNIRIGILLILCIVTIITLATTVGKSYLLTLIIEESYASSMSYFFGAFLLALNVIALLLCLKITIKKDKNILNLWICISVLACLLEISLSIIAGGRYTLGWYIARVFSIVSALSIFFIFIVEITFLYQKITANEMKLKELINIDGLTGIPNRRYLDEYLDKKIKLNERITFIMFDIDDYKLFNSYYGHQMGDECLKQVAQKALACAKKYEAIVARYGGEEFAIILPNSSLEQGYHISETIRKEIADMKIPHYGIGENEIVTCSFGISSTIVKDVLSIQSLVHQADLALFEAKRNGKNHTSIFKKGTQFIE